MTSRRRTCVLKWKVCAIEHVDGKMRLLARQHINALHTNVGRLRLHTADTAPSPQPTSSTLTRRGSSLANHSVSTRTRRFATNVLCRAPTARRWPWRILHCFP
jgi:hypothetical protein